MAEVTSPDAMPLPAGELGRFRQLLRVDMMAVGLAEVVLLGAWVFLHRTGWFLVLGAVVGVGGVVMGLGYRPLARGDVPGAVGHLAVGNWFIAPLAASIATFAWPLMTLAALLPTVVAAPYVSPRQLRGYLTVSLAVTVTTASLGLLQDFSGFEDEIASWLPPTVVIMFLPFLAWLVVQTALQNSVRLQDTLRATVAVNRRLERSEHALAEQAYSLRTSRARLVAAGDRERRRVERDLHDGAQQRLVALGLRLRLTEDLARRHPDQVADALAALRHEVHVVQTELRDLAHGVYPAVLTQHGLVEALEAAADRCPLAVALRSEAVGRLAPGIEAAVYFCCVEGLQNAVKHAGAGARVTVTLVRDGGVLAFTVADDGSGFDVHAVTRGDGFDNMRDRLGAAGGSLDVSSLPGRGTTLRGSVPAHPAHGRRGDVSPKPDGPLVPRTAD
jgi:signal transduction histidine kinase